LVERTTYFTRLRKYLKPDGKIIIIEYKPSKSFSFRGIFKHQVAKETIIQEMKQAGYNLEEEFDFLPEQHFTIHSKG
ncbi:MAG: class I SAM-dependent methyltransferase, partial [Candidatus Helarchaeota archaeon]